MKRTIFLKFMILLMMLMVLPTLSYAQARNASFANPMSTRSAGGGAATAPESLIADPVKTDAGETLVNVARRVTVFFYNGFRSPIDINNVIINSDGNVRSKIVANDCEEIKKLPINDKCSVAVEVTPSSPGPWTVELLMNHSGQGRITRAEILGATLGKTGDKAEGLAISKKIAQNLDFGAVEVFAEKSTRTMLIENDSNEPLKISTIDLITDESSGLVLRETGCKEGDELKAGESCPITVMWQPQSRGNLSTDLIVRHNGSLGFVVVPIRGVAKLEEGKEGQVASKGELMPRTLSSDNTRSSSSLSNISPPSLRQLTDALPAIRSLAIKDKKTEALPTLHLSLIGTVGERAILGTPSNHNIIIGLGEMLTLDDTEIELLQLDSNRAIVSVNGTRKELSIRKATSYIQTGKAQSGGDDGARTAPAAPPQMNESENNKDAETAPSEKTSSLQKNMQIAPITAQQLAILR